MPLGTGGAQGVCLSVRALMPIFSRSSLLLAIVLLGTGCTCASTTDIGGNGGSNGSGGGTGTGGMGGNGGFGGNSGVGGGTGGVGGGGADAGFYDDGGNFNPPDDSGVPYYDGGCGPIDAGNPPYPRKCAPTADSECSGVTDTFLTGRGVGAALLNGASGNGFDDDCDGLVDEGCSCPGNGQTKDCFLVPATQANPATKQPVGWCIPNAKGSLDCGGGELLSWSGVCRGASQPARHDSCSPGDFNCDGLSGNSDVTGCSCPALVTCPTAELSFAPFPPPGNIPLIDGSAWILDPVQRAAATNWTWTVLGGDCDNVLPFPTFALFNQANSSAAGARQGARTGVKYDTVLAKYVALAGQPLIAIQAVNFGNGVAGGQVHAAFALSGDYTVQGEFDLNGVHTVCTQKVRVRAPGIRAELCWDTVGGQGASQGTDIDLHFARLQGTSCGNKGWDDTCLINANGLLQDCFYATLSGCPSGAPAPGWGYADSPANACQGWGSKRGNGACTNPRLDRDNISCNRTEPDPNSQLVEFCGPENINIDNPKDNDRFVVGVNYYGGNLPTHPHVNLYCNGLRVLSIGYNPATGQTAFPALLKMGGDSTGDFWTAARITAHLDGGQLATCDVATLPSHHADPTRDGPSDGGSNSLCVDSTANMTPTPNQYNYASHKFVDPGSAQTGVAVGAQPTTPGQWCKH